MRCATVLLFCFSVLPRSRKAKCHAVDVSLTFHHSFDAHCNTREPACFWRVTLVYLLPQSLTFIVYENTFDTMAQINASASNSPLASRMPHSNRIRLFATKIRTKGQEVSAGELQEVMEIFVSNPFPQFHSILTSPTDAVHE